MDVSNARPLAIFAGYMITAATLSATSISIILNGAANRRVAASSQSKANSGTPSNRDHGSRKNLGMPIYMFSLLAGMSLFTTWYHMFRFFQWSYNEWAIDQTLEDPSKLYLGDWLRDTKLFKQAWASTLETSPRAFWSLPIFGFCAILSVMLAAQGKKRQIPYTWVFMLLGQIVAISFASNLFFIAVLVYDDASSARKGEKEDVDDAPGWLSAPSWYDTIIGITVAIAVNIPLQFEHPKFMLLLLGPHILAFFPVLLNGVLTGKAPSHMLNKPTLGVQLGTMLVLGIIATTMVVGEIAYGGAPLSNSETASRFVNVVEEALYGHPAVSSVGWDVICCWISYACWAILGL